MREVGTCAYIYTVIMLCERGRYAILCGRGRYAILCGRGRYGMCVRGGGRM